MAAFIQNSAAVIAKEGTTKGISMILKSILSKGAVEAGGVAAAGGTAAAGGSMAAVVTAFQALPVVGQVIAVVAAAVMVTVAVTRPFKVMGSLFCAGSPCSRAVFCVTVNEPSALMSIVKAVCVPPSEY